MIQKIRKSMPVFQWAEITAIVGFTIYFALTNHKDTWWYILIDSVTAVCGVVCVVLCAGGKKSQYYWGLANVVGYIVIALFNRYYGEVMLNGLYYLPSQFIGLKAWEKHYNQRDEKVEGLRMKGNKILIWAFSTALGVLLYKLVLDWLGGQATLLDSMSTVFSIVANVLMILRYREQWLLWIIVDIVTVIMWIIAGDFLMTIMWAIYLINAIYGYINWSKLSLNHVDI